MKATKERGDTILKNRYLSAIIYLAYGLLIAVGPQTLFKVCTSEASTMKCYWTSRGEIGVGVLFLFNAVIALVFKERQNQRLISIFGFGAGILALALPLYLIGGCGNSKMPCNTTAFPVIYLLTGLVLVYIVLNVVYLTAKIKVIKPGKRFENF